MKYIITDNIETFEKFKKCAKDHPESVDRMNNGVCCLKCLYTIIHGEYKPL